jgi:hypothetical protein
MQKLFAAPPSSEKPATAPNTKHQEIALLRDLNAMQELENQALKRQQN